MSGIVSIRNSQYPKLLKDIGDSPKQLYYKGIWDSTIFEHCLAVVGTRRMTTYGKRVTEQLVGGIAAAGITIVSGFMYGIDAAAHKAALRVGGRTIAVMPCGIDVIHPAYQKDLYNTILENGGLILSEYEGTFLPTLWSYPKRNRIVAGLSQATMVVEAGEKSGSLITANFAKKFSRKVFAVPGQITSTMSQGTMQLLKEGASVVTSAKDILDYYHSDLGFSLRFTLYPAQQDVGSHAPARRSLGAGGPAENPRSSQLPTLEGEILDHLRREPMEIDELARMLQVSIAKIGSVLSLFELSGTVTKEGGKYYIAS